jgi:hypothetical protein
MRRRRWLLSKNEFNGVDGSTTLCQNHASNAATSERRHVKHLDKNRYRNPGGRGRRSCRFLCAVCAKRRFGGSGKCANQRCRAGSGKRWWNEQCDGRSERGRQRCQSSRAAAAAHKRPGDSEIQVIANKVAFGVLIVLLVIGGSLWIMANLNHNMMPMDQIMQMQR